MSYRSGARTCERQGCHQSTREGKPFCSEHVGLNPYALRIAQEIVKRDSEDAVVAAGNTPASGYNVQGLTAQAILQHLVEHGTRTKARLCRELILERKVLDGYVEALIKKGIVSEGMTRRGAATLILLNPDSSQSHP